MTAPDPARLRLRLASPEATARLAARIAPLLKPGDTLLLDGEIGAGKTHFARSLIQSRLVAEGRTEEVPSPTFTLVQTYGSGGDAIWHADLYRTTGPDEVRELGLDEAFSDAICLVEWPDRLGDLASEKALFLRFSPGAGPEERVLDVRGDARRWSAVLHAMAGAEAAP